MTAPTPTATPSPCCAPTATGRRPTRRRTCCPTCTPGQRLLDVGSGPGTITADLAASRGRRGRRPRGQRGGGGADPAGRAAASTYASVTCTRWPSRRRVRRRARPPGAAARRRPGRGVARDGPGDEARGSGRRARLRLRDLRVVAPPAGARPLAGAVRRRRTRQRRRARRRASAPGLGARRGPGRGGGVAPRRGASPPPRPARGGAACGPTASSAPPSAEQLLREGRATPEELERISARLARWADDPDGWFSVHHGEIIAASVRFERVDSAYHAGASRHSTRRPARLAPQPREITGLG